MTQVRSPSATGVGSLAGCKASRLTPFYLFGCRGFSRPHAPSRLHSEPATNLSLATACSHHLRFFLLSFRFAAYSRLLQPDAERGLAPVCDVSTSKPA